ncbi:MAG: phosphatase PAP2 family protein [Thermodesulfobacteriota bacterium]
MKNLRKLRALLLFAVFIISIPLNSKGEDTVPPDSEGFLHYFSRTLPINLLIGTKNSVTGWNLAILGVGTGTAITLSQTDADKEVQNSLEGSLGNFAEIGNIGGNTLVITGITVTSYIVARQIKDEKFLQTTEALIESEIITAVMTEGLKVSVGRKRPNGDNNRFSSSFPSGHVSASFALATTFDSMYGYKIGIPLYIFSSFVGLSRISDNKHFLSDVLFGAALGTAIGRGVAQIHKNGTRGNITVMPYTDGANTGLALSMSW